MGAWGTGSFENDDACDWAAELEDLSDFSLVEEALQSVVESEEYIDCDNGCVAIAAAEVVASSLGNFGDHDGDTAEAVENFIERVGQPASDELRKMALQALKMVLGDESELPDLWAEDTAWKSSISDLKSRLQN